MLPVEPENNTIDGNKHPVLVCVTFNIHVLSGNGMPLLLKIKTDNHQHQKIFSACARKNNMLRIIV